jgi:hypothetical protein
MNEIEESYLLTVSFCPCRVDNVEPPGPKLQVGASSPLNILLSDVGFQPDFVRIEMVSYTTDTPDFGLYVLRSNLVPNNTPLVSFTGKQTFTVNMSETIALKSPIENLTFQILQLYNGILPNNTYPFNTYGPPAPGAGSVTPASTMNGNTTFSITLNFFRIKKYKNDYFRNT